MFLKSLSLVNYKNFAQAQYDFDQKINCFVGSNGAGKTNSLDAVYHLSFGKSYFNPITSQNILHGEDFFLIDGTYQKEEKQSQVVVSAKRSAKKIIKMNGKLYDKLSDHVGKIPLVIISPADRDLITEGSDTRRKFMDRVISQGDKVYLQQLITYTKILAQRNSLLKYFAANRTFDRTNIEVYDLKLNDLGKEIHAKRTAFINELVPILESHYQRVSGNQEQVSLRYNSHLESHTSLQLFEEYLQKDMALQYTSKGVHKDDLLFEIAGHQIKKFGSQGQQKSFLIALKLAQFDFLKVHSGTTPILLLDDIFDKLDENRVSHIVQLVEEDHFGQIFISDTHPERTQEIVSKTSQSYKMFEL